MATKKELAEQAEALGIDVDSTWTKTELEAAVEDVLAEEEQEDVPSEDDDAPAAVTAAPQPQEETAGKCDNCDSPAVYESDGITSSKIKLCVKHAPK